MGRKGRVKRMGTKRNQYRVLVEVSEGKSLLGITRNVRNDNIKMDVNAVEWHSFDWINLDQKKENWRNVSNT
jgi:hypothetical protein